MVAYVPPYPRHVASGLAPSPRKLHVVRSHHQLVRVAAEEDVFFVLDGPQRVAEGRVGLFSLLGGVHEAEIHLNEIYPLGDKSKINWR